MAASLGGTKTVTVTLAPHLTATILTNLLAVAPEDMTVAQVTTLNDALARCAKGHDPASVVGTLLV